MVLQLPLELRIPTTVAFATAKDDTCAPLKADLTKFFSVIALLKQRQLLVKK
jgi:hypothetical protein